MNAVTPHRQALRKDRRMKALKRFFKTHAGRGTIGVYLAALLIAWPPALSWMAAACVLWWAARHLRQSFRVADESQPSPGSVPVRADSVPARPAGDPLDLATQLDMAVRGSLTVVPGFEIVPVAVPVRDDAADWQRQCANGKHC
jgi:hypothetical protein